jgi:hypothetical protein
VSDHNATAEASMPAFHGKVVVLYRDYYHVIGALAGCRFERIAGRMYLVGQELSTQFALQFPGGMTLAIAWDSPQAESFVLFDSRETFEQWRDAPREEHTPF